MWCYILHLPLLFCGSSGFFHSCYRKLDNLTCYTSLPLWGSSLLLGTSGRLPFALQSLASPALYFAVLFPLISPSMRLLGHLLGLPDRRLGSHMICLLQFCTSIPLSSLSLSSFLLCYSLYPCGGVSLLSRPVVVFFPSVSRQTWKCFLQIEHCIQTTSSLGWVWTVVLPFWSRGALR